MNRYTLRVDGQIVGTWAGNTPEEAWEAYLASEHKKADGSPMYPAPGLDAFLKARKLTRDGSTQTSVPDRPRPHIHAELVEG